MHKNSNLIILFLDISIILLSEFLIYFKPPENWWQRQFLHVRVVIINENNLIASTSTKHVKIRHDALYNIQRNDILLMNESGTYRKVLYESK